MITKKYTSIFIGNNSINLLGCYNDASLFYNLNIFQNKFILLNNDATIIHLEKILKNNNNTTELFIFFSGHGFRGGCLKLYDTILKPSSLYELINNIFINQINLYLILDCCFSGGFPQIKNYNKIKNTLIIASSDKNEKSIESIVIYDEKLFIEYKPKIIKNYIVIGSFSYNFVKMLLQKNILDINNIFLLKDEINELKIITKQNIIIKD
jgi:hypothetical protein